MPGRFFSQLAFIQHLRSSDPTPFVNEAPWVHDVRGIRRRFVIARVARRD